MAVGMVIVEGGKEVDVDVVMVEADTEVDVVDTIGPAQNAEPVFLRLRHHATSVESPNLPRLHATEPVPKFLKAATGLSIVS